MRPAYRELGGRGANPVVLGRKHCTRCGHWRPVLDFYPRRRDLDGVATSWQSVCVTCMRTRQRDTAGLRRRGKPYAQRQARLTAEQRRVRQRERYRQRRKDPIWLARYREYGRIYQEANRRKRGIAPRNFHNRRTVIDKLEWVYLQPEPLVDALRGVEIRALSRRAKVPERSIDRLLRGESRHVRIDLADRLALALGLSLSLIYDVDAPVVRGRLPRMAA
jgi:hypothetical protein